eukprot:452093-Rhodomonas_salina.1
MRGIFLHGPVAFVSDEDEERVRVALPHDVASKSVELALITLDVSEHNTFVCAWEQSPDAQESLIAQRRVVRDQHHKSELRELVQRLATFFEHKRHSLDDPLCHCLLLLVYTVGHLP